MLASQTALQDRESVMFLVVIIAVATVIFWRLALRILAIALLILLIYGAASLFQSVSHSEPLSRPPTDQDQVQKEAQGAGSAAVADCKPAPKVHNRPAPR
jgi:membrane protein implicated in regulation of membrane protease activity